LTRQHEAALGIEGTDKEKAMPVDVIQKLTELVQSIIGDHDAAAQFAGDPQGTFAAQGLADADYSGVDMRQIVADACEGMPGGGPSALQSYTSGGSGSTSYPAPASSSSVDQVMQHMNTVTYVTYSDDHSITQLIEDNSVDNSTEVNISDSNINGDVDVDVDNTTATDGGVASSGSGDVNAATGDGAQVIDGDNYGVANTGDGNTINQVEGDAVIGDNNITDQSDTDIDIDAENADGTVFNFGDGDVSNINDSTVDDSAVSAGGDATNTSSEENETNTVNADHSVVQTEQGEGDAQQQVQTQVEVEHEPMPEPEPEPVVLYHEEAPAPAEAPDPALLDS
jgi:hypothetical protein